MTMTLDSARKILNIAAAVFRAADSIRKELGK